MDAPTTIEGLQERLTMDFASAFIRIRGAHNPKPGEPCAWCRLAAEQATEAVVTTGILERIRAFAPESDAETKPDPGWAHGPHNDPAGLYDDQWEPATEAVGESA